MTHQTKLHLWQSEISGPPSTVIWFIPFAIEHYATLLKFKGLIFLSFYCNNKAKGATGSTSSCSTVCITRRMAVCFQRKSDNHWRSGPAVVVETQTNLHTRTHTHAHMRARTHTHMLIKRVSSPEKEEMIRKPISLLNRKQTPVAHFSFRSSHTSLASTHFQHHQCYLYYIYNIYNLKKPNFQTNVGFFLYWHWSCSFRQRYSVTHYLTRRKKKNTPVTAMYI